MNVGCVRLMLGMRENVNDFLIEFALKIVLLKRQDVCRLINMNGHCFSYSHTHTQSKIHTAHYAFFQLMNYKWSGLLFQLPYFKGWLEIGSFFSGGWWAEYGRWLYSTTWKFPFQIAAGRMLLMNAKQTISTHRKKKFAPFQASLKSNFGWQKKMYIFLVPNKAHVCGKGCEYVWQVDT